MNIYDLMRSHDTVQTLSVRKALQEELGVMVLVNANWDNQLDGFRVDFEPIGIRRDGVVKPGFKTNACVVKSRGLVWDPSTAELDTMVYSEEMKRQIELLAMREFPRNMGNRVILGFEVYRQPSAEEVIYDVDTIKLSVVSRVINDLKEVYWSEG